MDVTEEIKQINIEDIIKSAGVELKNGGGRRRVGLCPFHAEKGASFTVYPENTFYCFGCGAGGDAAEFIMRFYSVEFPEALQRLGIESDGKKPVAAPLRRPKLVTEKKKESTMVAVFGRPNEIWTGRANKFSGWCHDQLLENDEQLRWLAARGIDRESVMRFRLGWNPGESDDKPCFYRHRKSWGLPDEIKKNGKKKMLWLPRGLVIPLMDGDNVLRLRIRGERPRYYVIPGSNMGLMIINGDHRCMVVVESELDAILLAAAAGDLAGYIAMGTAIAKPDAPADFYLRKASYVILALDYDAAGAKAIAWWLTYLPAAKIWPVPDGKDPGEAYQASCDLRQWIMAGYPAGWLIKKTLPGERPVSNEIQSPVAFGAVADVVTELAELIKNTPVRIVVTDTSVKLLAPIRWSSKKWDIYKQISEKVYFDSVVWDYLHDHPDEIITPKNLMPA